MSYDDIDSDHLTHRHRKRRSRPGGVFILFVAFLAFLVIGFSVSLSIRACTHRASTKTEKKPDEVPQLSAIVAEKAAGAESVEQQEIPTPYTMPDSMVWICTPKPLGGVSEVILRKTAFIVSYNKDTKLANWVAWNLAGEHTDGPYRRMSSFYEDEEVPLPRATNDDYRGSGWSRGHMCPAGDNKWNEQAMYDTFSLVNVCPQNANLNSGLWNSIEMDCRRWARKFGDVYIVCGPIYMKREHEMIGNHLIAVPEAFFKVVLCLNGIPKAIGFIVRNTDGMKKRDLYYNSIDQVERITGMDFFPALPYDIENEVEANASIDDWR